MKRLFVVSNDYEIDLNKEWLHLVPEFSIILHRVWKCEGDADGRKKVMQKKIFGYIWLVVDYGSILFTWDKDARKQEALKMMGLKEADVDEPKVAAAVVEYERLQLESVPALKALRGMYASLDKMNEFLEDIDLAAEDKQGKPKYTPSAITRAVKEMNAAYDSVAIMERRVMEQLKKEGSNTIRGTATLGGKEGKRRKEWAEGVGPVSTELQKSVEKAIDEDESLAITDTTPDFKNMGSYLKDLTKDEEA